MFHRVQGWEARRMRPIRASWINLFLDEFIGEASRGIADPARRGRKLPNRPDAHSFKTPLSEMTSSETSRLFELRPTLLETTPLGVTPLEAGLI